MKRVCPCCGEEFEVGVLAYIREVIRATLRKVYDYVLGKIAEFIEDLYSMRLGGAYYERVDWWSED